MIPYGTLSIVVRLKPRWTDADRDYPRGLAYGATAADMAAEHVRNLLNDVIATGLHGHAGHGCGFISARINAYAGCRGGDRAGTRIAMLEFRIGGDHLARVDIGDLRHLDEQQLERFQDAFQYMFNNVPEWRCGDVRGPVPSDLLRDFPAIAAAQDNPPVETGLEFADADRLRQSLAEALDLAQGESSVWRATWQPAHKEPAIERAMAVYRTFSRQAGDLLGKPDDGRDNDLAWMLGCLALAQTAKRRLEQREHCDHADLHWLWTAGVGQAVDHALLAGPEPKRFEYTKVRPADHYWNDQFAEDRREKAVAVLARYNSALHGRGVWRYSAGRQDWLPAETIGQADEWLAQTQRPVLLGAYGDLKANWRTDGGSLLVMQAARQIP